MNSTLLSLILDQGLANDYEILQEHLARSCKNDRLLMFLDVYKNNEIKKVLKILTKRF